MAQRSNTIDNLREALSEIVCADGPAIRRELNRLKAFPDVSDAGYITVLSRLENLIQKSIARRKRREKSVPAVTCDPALPITSRRQEIIQAIQTNPVVIVSGETGSGKTTQIPKFCLEAGRGIRGKIGCTQPRRIAAINVARRIAAELGQEVGGCVGYKIRFQDTLSPHALIKIMTDGILLAETQGDRYLNEYDTLIIDEAHERSLNIDFCLGILKTILQKRNDLRVVITSATIDTFKFSSAFNRAPVIEVSGRMYPVEVRYDPPGAGEGDESSHIEAAVRTLEKLLVASHAGDILVFMPTEQDIRETCDLLRGRFEGRYAVMPLFARLPAGEQTKVFDRAGKRKIIVATNIAETSITIPGIKYVIDSGLARIAGYSPRTRTTSLPVVPVSRSSADQRMGRCGRVENGVCIRLYPQEDYEGRPQYTPPEILRTNLAEVILRMMALKIGHVSTFPFVDPPLPKSVKDGYELLLELGAIRPGKRKRSTSKEVFLLTEKGRLMASIPLDPRLSAMLIEARRQGCFNEVAIIASGISIQDPRERPPDREKEADNAHRQFVDGASDFLTLANIWKAYHRALKELKSGNQMKKYCREHFLSYRRMREWRDVHSQIQAIFAENSGPETQTRQRKMAVDKTSPFDIRYTAVHKSILSGYLSNIAFKKEKNMFLATKSRDAMIFPGSSLFNQAPSWIVAAEMVETSRLFARTAAGIDSAWLEELGRPMCRSVYRDPHWERKRGEVVATEQVSLFGLVIVSGRPVSYGRINPDEASDIFIRSALVEGDVREPLPFMVHNRRKIEEVSAIEDRMRRRDILVSPEDLYDFYRRRLPAVHDMSTLKRIVRDKGSDGFLRMTDADLYRMDPDQEELARFPERIQIGKQHFSCTYHFDPGKEVDGVTVEIPSTLASAVPSEAMDWLVPGLLPEKITALIKGLPKEYRKQLVPVADTVHAIVAEMQRTGSLAGALGKFIYERFGVDIPASAWPLDQLSDHLKMRIAITDEKGKIVESSRDPHVLKKPPVEPGGSPLFEMAKKKWERENLTGWDFPDMPGAVELSEKGAPPLVVFPALVKEKSGTVHLRLFHEREKAERAHREGVCGLLEIHFAKDIKHLRKGLTLSGKAASLAEYFGGSRRLVEQMVKRIAKELFERDIRSEAAFHEHATEVGQGIQLAGQALLSQVEPLLKTYSMVRSDIYELETQYTAPVLAEFFKGLRNELVHLIPVNFIALYDPERYGHLTRYVKALGIRARRAMMDYEKERKRAEETAVYQEALDRMLQEMSPHTTPEKREKIELFFWMLQEYKVSVFAQELKTAMPVSPKRLNQLIKQIQRMV